MRNGDYLPTRLQAQQDAVNTICRFKLRSNPENNVGLITLSKCVIAARFIAGGVYCKLEFVLQFTFSFANLPFSLYIL